jgi:lipopolysaccharide export system protein LptA
VRWILATAVLIVVIAAGTASGQPLPITVDADTITYDSAQQVVTAQGHVRIALAPYRLFADASRYDLRSQVVVATGHVRVLDDQEREMRGQTLTYNNRTKEGVLEVTEGLIDRERRVYLRGSRLDFNPDRFISYDSFLTTCDPLRPVVHVSAKRIEVVPNEQIIAYDAAVYVGNRHVLTLRRYVVSLRPDEPGTAFPAFGSSSVDGYWVAYSMPLRIAENRGQLTLKYGTTSGIAPLLQLTHPEQTYGVTLRVGRTQTVDDREFFDLLQYDVAEIAASSKPIRIGSAPLSWTLSGGAAAFSERLTAGQLANLGRTSNVSTSRLDGQLLVATDRLPLAPRLTYGLQAGFRVSSYGTRDTRTITFYGADLDYSLDAFTTVTLSYQRAAIGGRTPLAIDEVDPQNTIGLALSRTVTDHYLASVGVAHNAALAETKLTGLVAVIVNPSWELSVSAVYNTRLKAFEDIDYSVRRLCDCVDVTLRYRSVRHEVSLQFGLLGFGQRQAPTVPRSVQPFIFPTDRR